jgi:two-component system KDP operon response regulator KdpE
MMSDYKSTLVSVIEHEEHEQKFLQYLLQSEGYMAKGAANGQEALRLLKEEPDLIIMGWQLPDEDGLALCYKIRSVTNCPLVILSATTDEARKVAAFRAGADDYIVKPYSQAELLARLEALLRRYQQWSNHKPKKIRVGSLLVDLDLQRITRKGIAVHLSATEWRLFKTFLKHSNQVVSIERLLELVWGPEYAGAKQYIHVYIRRLRRLLEINPDRPRLIVTEWGVGYRLVTNSALNQQAKRASEPLRLNRLNGHALPSRVS